MSDSKRIDLSKDVSAGISETVVARRVFDSAEGALTRVPASEMQSASKVLADAIQGALDRDKLRAMRSMGSIVPKSFAAPRPVMPNVSTAFVMPKLHATGLKKLDASIGGQKFGGVEPIRFRLVQGKPK